MGTNAYDDLPADIYDQMHPDALSGTAETVEFVSTLCPPGGSVLELGVGNGRLAVPPAGRGVDVYGIDSSARMLADLAVRDSAGAVKAIEGDFLTATTGRRHDVVLMALNTLIDAMARCAGLRLVERYAGWSKEPCGPGSQRHVSVYEAADAA